MKWMADAAVLFPLCSAVILPPWLAFGLGGPWCVLIIHYSEHELVFVLVVITHKDDEDETMGECSEFNQNNKSKLCHPQLGIVNALTSGLTSHMDMACLRSPLLSSLVIRRRMLMEWVWFDRLWTKKFIKERNMGKTREKRKEKNEQRDSSYTQLVVWCGLLDEKTGYLLRRIISLFKFEPSPYYSTLGLLSFFGIKYKIKIMMSYY